MLNASYLRALLPSLLLILGLTLTACQEAEAEDPGSASSADQNEELARQYIDAYNARDVAVLEETLAERIKINGEEESRGDFLEVVQGYWAVFPDIELQPTHIIGAEDHVTIRMEFTATGTGEWLSHDIDGREVRASEIILFGVSEGQLGEYWYNWDELGFWEQLGVLESPYPDA